MARPATSQTGLFFTLPQASSAQTLAQTTGPQEQFVPLKEVKVHATLEGALATIDFDMIYTNPSDKPIETTYEFPLEADTVISSLTFKIGGKEICTSV